mgnify:CR=1 FL=1
MRNSEDLSNVIESLQKALERLDELESRVAAIKVAEALEILLTDENNTN